MTWKTELGWSVYFWEAPLALYGEMLKIYVEKLKFYFKFPHVSEL